MATDIKIPSLGESISEAVISSWLKSDGAYVERDEEIVELETDKVTMPLPAPAAGVMKIAVKEGDTVGIGDVIGSIDESASKGDGKKQEGAREEAKAGAGAGSGAGSASGSKGGEAGASESESKPAKKQDDGGSSGSGGSAKGSGSGSGSSDGVGGEENGAVFSTPVARRLAEEHGVRLSAIHGTGPGGRIREHDVLAYLQSHEGGEGDGGASGGSSGAGGGTGGGGRGVSRGKRVEKMSPLRQRIAVRLVEAQHTAAMLTTFNECDMTNVMSLRSQHKEAFEKRHGVKLGFMSFFVKAAVSALRTVPSVNASIVDTETGPGVEHHDYCDIAVAVGTPKGLVVPVLRNAESLDFAGIESGIGELAKKARDGKLTLEDMQGGTFTISNGGVYGSMLSTPILNPPQSGILGMHNIIRRPVERPDKPGSGEVVVRPMMYLALSYDHRIVDGEGAVTFLKHIKECIESPERLLLGV
ncbi:MAG: 2-oxoglutarate dehydrogenase complex dihydrolipoyllysine-residue succinyltransferase [Phycisphaerales bacterium]